MARPSRPSSRSRPASGAMNGASARSASTARTPAITWGGSVGPWWGAFCGSPRRRYPPSSHTRDGASSGAASDAGGRASASTNVRSGSRRAARAASGGRPAASGSRRACAATSSASWRRSSPQRAGSASQPLAVTGGRLCTSPGTSPGTSPAVTPMAATALARSSPWRRSRSAAVGRSGQAASSRPAAAAAPRRTSSGGATSSTVAPRMVTPALPGSRSSSRSPTCIGSGSRSVSRATPVSSEPRGRSRAKVRAEPMWTVMSCGRRSAGDSHDGSDSLTSISLVSVQRPASTRAMPRAGTSAAIPRRLSATRATPLAEGTGSASDSMPRILAGRRDGVSSSSCPDRMVPAGSVPVTTVPLPRILNDRSTHSRTGAAGSGTGSEATRRASAARSSGSPAPVTALTATASTEPRLDRARCSAACRVAGPGSARSQRVTASRPCRMPIASMAARCSADCGIQPPSAATTTSTAGTAPTPASMFGTNRSWPGTSTNANRSPSGNVIQANPRSMVSPRRRSSAHRSGSIPVSALTSADFP
jgi:hypothetical protein